MTKKPKLKVTDFSGHNFYPGETFRENLEHLVIYPEGEFKRDGVPNGSVWVYRDVGQKYDQRILFNDVGCGMIAFNMPPIDVKNAADAIATYLKGTRILGSGNHFIDLCGPFNPKYENTLGLDGWVLAIHTDAKTLDESGKIPTTFEEAEPKIKMAENLREELGHSISKILGLSYLKKIGNWSHNTVEREDGKIIYRKGSIKVEPGKPYMLPAHLGASILFYAVNPNNIPPFESMPHATGRKKATGISKVSIEKVQELRKMIYIPSVIQDTSLRAEHPDCFNDADNIHRDLGKHVVVLGDSKILAYIGKI